LCRRLTYWVCFAFFTLLEVFVEYILYFIPFYFALKLAFIVWLQLPNTRGAEFVYSHIVLPFLLKNETAIDTNLHRATKSGMEFLRDARTAASSVTRDAVSSSTGQAMMHAAVTTAVSSGDSSMPTAEAVSMEQATVVQSNEMGADNDIVSPPALPVSGSERPKDE
jgi:receptor expression-enhancing protein 5/6